MESSEIVVLLVVAAHLGVLIWAITNKHPWWALGIFFFPVVGDIAYAIYYFATMDRAQQRPLRGARSVEIGDAVIVRPRVLYDQRGRASLRRGERVVVTRIEGWPRYLTVRTENGNEFTGFRPAAFDIDKPVTKMNSRPMPASDLRIQLEELLQLREDGLITEDELSAKKRQILGLE